MPSSGSSLARIRLWFSQELKNGLLDQFDLKQVAFDHKTYHHFTGDGQSDSQLDLLLYPTAAASPEKIQNILCSLEQPLINSHHDILLSTFALSRTFDEHLQVGNVVAPKVPNIRVKTLWSEEGKQKYEQLIGNFLPELQQRWLSPPTKSSLSILLKSS